MTDPVVLPFWLVTLLVILALWAAVTSFFLPGVRWYLRRRVNLLIDELNSRLQLKIEPFRLTRRQTLIDRLEFDPAVIQGVEEHVTETGESREEAMDRVRIYAREIVPSFNAYLYFRVGYKIAQWTIRVLFRVRLGTRNDEPLGEVGQETSVVFVMNHRSNVDYVLVAYLVATRSALSYAVGEWAKVWPLQTLLRSLGAFFIRRGSGDRLYRKVLAAYVKMAVQGGVTQALYPEGGLTRDGKLRDAKMGLLGYMINGFDPASGRDLLFVPVGINYDRVFEDRSLLASTSEEYQRKTGLEAAMTTIRFIAKNFLLITRRQWYRFGYAGVNFGRPLSLQKYCEEKNIDLATQTEEERRQLTEGIADELMAAIGEAIPVLPVSLVATLFLAEAAPISELGLKAKAYSLMARLEESGAKVYIPRGDRDYAIAYGLRNLVLRGFVFEEEGLYRANPAEQKILAYYANAIVHLVADVTSEAAA